MRSVNEITCDEFKAQLLKSIKTHTSASEKDEITIDHIKVTACLENKEEVAFTKLIININTDA